MADKDKILAGRKVIEAYKEAHHQLHSKPWHRGVPDEHTLIQDETLAELKKLGFDSFEELFDASDALNFEVFSATYQPAGECDGCPDREAGCVPSCFAALAHFNETLGRLVLPPEKWTRQVALTSVRHFGLPDAAGNLVPNCKLKLIKVQEPDVDWQWH